MMAALTVDDGERESDLGVAMNDLSIRRPCGKQVPILRGLSILDGIVGCAKALFAPCPPFASNILVGTLSLSSGAHSRDPLALPTLRSDHERPHQILPVTSFCMRLAISTSRRHACS